ncbi:MAG TPA: DUF885 domain-containing protein [Chitinophagaceae bacterium]|nr:DUF885 domain-containing protein [Chitinophagaceae bacterium]
MQRLIQGCSALLLIFCSILWTSCHNESESLPPSKELKDLFQHYWDERMQLYPLEATAIGDNRYNDRLTITISDTFRTHAKEFYQRYLTQSQAFSGKLNKADQLSKDLFEYELSIHLKEFEFPFHLMPINQFWSFTLEFPQLGSGDAAQPFKTVKDYDQFLARMQQFPAWIETAIGNMREGMKQGIVLPKILASKMIPQIKGLLTIDPTRSIFYNPIKKLPADFSEADKKRLENAYFYHISQYIIPSYSKLENFLRDDYIPACRETHGISAIPNGRAYYDYLIQYYTTTDLSADSIYNLGLQEVARIEAEMENVKTSVGFTGTLPAFFTYLNSDPQFYPFTTPKQVLDSFWAIHKTEEPFLKRIFEQTPKTKFEIRQTEEYRAASASAEYNAGSEDGTRPGIFYTPILDPKKFNAVGMETLFLHEAIPGHHYQISLQQENKDLPQFRKFLGYSAYAEGWALYTETLGKDLGLYKNPYQYFGHLSDAMHRALRLVIDAGIHTRQLSHDSAIAYMTSHERISAQEAEAEIERYMAIPGQALSYKIGQLTISAMKATSQKQLGAKFNLAAFHTQVLNGGNMPLEVLEKKLADWTKTY